MDELKGFDQGQTSVWEKSPTYLSFLRMARIGPTNPLTTRRSWHVFGVQVSGYLRVFTNAVDLLIEDKPYCVDSPRVVGWDKRHPR